MAHLVVTLPTDRLNAELFYVAGVDVPVAQAGARGYWPAAVGAAIDGVPAGVERGPNDRPL